MNEIAGRELDALVAVRVMEWFWHPNRCEWCGWPFDASGIGCLPDNCSQRPMSKVKQSTDYPPYSSDISATWLVVEKMREKSRVIIDHDGLSWVVHFPDIPDVRAIASADTAPLAICLAALAAKE